MHSQASLLANYVLELAVVDAGMLRYSYSTIAAAAVYVAMKVRRTGGRLSAAVFLYE